MRLMDEQVNATLINLQENIPDDLSTLPPVATRIHREATGQMGRFVGSLGPTPVGSPILTPIDMGNLDRTRHERISEDHQSSAEVWANLHADNPFRDG